VPLAADPGDLDAVVSDLLKFSGASHATWSLSGPE
jgi:hypothetical protein